MRDLAPDINDKLRIVEHGAQRASRIVQNLLAFSRKQRVEPRPIDLNEVLRQTLELKVYDLLGSQVELELDLAPVLPEVFADMGQMQSVFLNLVNNAQDAITAHNGKGTIRITTEFVGEKVRIKLADDGPGIPEADLKKIFDPFFTTKPIGKGTGLSLSICHGIVQEHEGTMSVDSEPGKGATFILEFAPALPDQADPSEENEESEVIVVGSGRILVIDDELVVREVLENALSRDGYQVETLASPREALPMLEQVQYDLILADLKNPEMSGKEFFEELSKLVPDMISRVIFITGDATSPKAKEFLDGAGRPVIEKPFELRALQRQVAKALV
jgi:CheY-like chemotaxis protein